MKKLILFSAFCAAGLLGLQDVASAHGGTYRGPGDTVPPGGGGGGGGGAPSAPGPAGPSSGGPAAPGAPGPSTPGAAAGQPAAAQAATTLGGAGGPDLTVWQFWWGFNKEPYLNIKSKIHSGGVVTGSDTFFLGQGEQEQAKNSRAPSEADIRNLVVPALIKALETEKNNDILTGSMIALAKIGDSTDEAGESQFVKIFTSFLSDGVQEVAETGALSLGILANEASVPALVALAKDEPEGRKLVEANEVPYRTRAFATYGLGLIGARTSDNTLRQDIAEHLVDLLEAPHFSTRDVKVAAMTALGLTGIDVVADPAAALEGVEEGSNRRHVVSRQAQVDYIVDYFDPANERANNKTRHWFVRAHAPAAMARLLATAPDQDELKSRVTEVILRACNRHSKEQREVLQSCSLALGQIGDADNGKDDIDTTIRAELIRLAKEGEEQSKRYALMGLAQSSSRPGQGDDPYAGLPEGRAELLKQMSRGKTQLKPWAALSLGVMGRALLDAQQSVDPSMLLAVRAACKDNKRPAECGAFMIALGMMRDSESMDLLLEKLDFFAGSNEARGEATVALGLMENRNAVKPIQEVILGSKYRPDLLKQAAIGLGLLGDKELVPDLLTMLSEANGLATQAAIASALGAIGDQRSLAPLVTMLENDKDMTDTARGFAAVALGIVCDKEPVPWNTKISTDINYRANTVTLTSSSLGTGILDIL